MNIEYGIVNDEGEAKGGHSWPPTVSGYLPGTSPGGMPRNSDWNDRTDAYNMGAGFRYFVARQYGLRAGIDVARGPEDWAFYIQIGQAWGGY